MSHGNLRGLAAMRPLMAGLGAAGLALWAAAGHAGTAPGVFPPNVAPPPLSARALQHFQTHPDDWSRLVSRLPRLSARQASPGALRAAINRSAVNATTSGNSAAGGSWSVVTPVDPSIGLTNPLLLTDGTVIVHNGDAPDWYKLTPDAKGNYANGVWTAIAPMPVINGSSYGPLYFASAVLPDGRVIVEGGEYNNSNTGVWTNEGAIYDPVADTWTAVNPPAGGSWSQIGDAQSVVLPNGTFMLAACCAFQPAADALFNPATLGWTATGAPTAGLGYQDEQGYELLPTGNVLTLDIWTNLFNNNGPAFNAEQYSPLTGVWSSAGSMPVSLPDDPQCQTYEIGPAVTRGDGKLVAFGGHTGCVAATAIDPTAIYDTATGTWTRGPDVPSICGGGATPCDLADAPAALEPDGAILFAASAGYGQNPTHFFEFNTANAIAQVSDPQLYADVSGAYYYNFLVLPNGQILSTDFSNIAEVYTPSRPPVAAWAPRILYGPATLVHGHAYFLSGRQLNGVSQGAYYGDDAQASTNYPIVKIVNVATGDVAYARTSNPSSMSITPGAAGSVTFAVPATIETGPSRLYVVANGVPSAPRNVTVN